MKKNKGFSLIELMVVIAIIGIVSAIAVPGMIGWRERGRLRGAANTTLADLQYARSMAIKENESVITQFTTNGYTITTTGGKALRTRQLPSGVRIINITLSDSDSDGNPDTVFNSRGIPVPDVANSNVGSFEITASAGIRQINISLAGRINIS